jgi:Flp pilus assembly protein TadG
MRSLIARRLHGDESGVTMVIVALCLIALFGMIVLVVDVGGLLWNRRAMVNASDAAALAAAKSCVLPASLDPSYPDGRAGAEQAADAYAGGNSSGADVSNPNNIIGISNTCDAGDIGDTGYVTVQYGANQQLFFAGIFGQGQGHVTTQATAIWGPAGAANPMPIVIYQNSFQNCEFDKIDPNKTCYVWEDNNNTSPGSAFGLLDLRTDNPSQYGWDSDAGAGCTDPGSQVDQWITQYPDNSVGDLPLNYPSPTYVCRVNGMEQNSWDDFAKLKGQTLFFPINRCDTVLPGNPGGQLLKNSTNEAACATTPGQYDIIGYFAAKLVNVYRTNQVSAGSGNCTAARTFPGPNNPFNVYSMFQATQVTPCPTDAPDLITNVVVGKVKKKDPGPAPVDGTDYVVSYSNPADPSITWLPSGPANENQDYNVSFDWSTSGKCGIPPSGNNSGHCIILQPVQVQIGGSHPGGGIGNVRAFKLCEPNPDLVSGGDSCSPVIVPKPNP